MPPPPGFNEIMHLNGTLMNIGTSKPTARVVVKGTLAPGPGTAYTTTQTYRMYMQPATTSMASLCKLNSDDVSIAMLANAWAPRKIAGFLFIEGDVSNVRSVMLTDSASQRVLMDLAPLCPTCGDF